MGLVGEAVLLHELALQERIVLVGRDAGVPPEREPEEGGLAGERAGVGVECFEVACPALPGAPDRQAVPVNEPDARGQLRLEALDVKAPVVVQVLHEIETGQVAG